MNFLFHLFAFRHKAAIGLRGLVLCLGVSVLWVAELRAQNGSAMGRLYRNTTAYYNALFIARKTEKQIDEHVRKEEIRNYEEILPVYLRYDSITTGGVREEVEKVINMASMVIKYRDKSRWAPEAYLLLAYGRLQHGDSLEARRTLRYLAKTTTNADARWAAQNGLLRFLTQDSLLEESRTIAQYIAKNPPTKGSVRLHYLLGLAYLAQRLGRVEASVRYILSAMEWVKDRYTETRLSFILGQSYEALGMPEKAYPYYAKCARRVLPYDFSLEAQLRTWVCAQAAGKKSLKKLRRYFKRAARQRKNQSFGSTVYFHYARLEEYAGNTKQALQRYKETTTAIPSDALLAGRAHEWIAQYLDNQDNIIGAASSYDSASNLLPITARGYAALAKKAEIYGRLAKEESTIEKNEDLLFLAELPTDSLSVELARRGAAEKARLEAAEEARKKAAKASGIAQYRNNADKKTEGSKRLPDQAGGNSGVYFYEALASKRGKERFLRIWGNRPRVDNWRRQSAITSIAVSSLSPTAAASSTGNQPTAASATEKLNVAKNATPASSTLEERLLQQIPKDEAQKQALARPLAAAYYQSGGILYYELHQRARALERFEKLVNNHPQFLKRAKILYLLALEDSLPKAKRAVYEKELRLNYADSVYVALLDNPNHLIDVAAASRELEAAYARAYKAYKADEVSMARKLLLAALSKQHLSNSFSDNARLLDITLDAKEGLPYRYQYRLRRFLRDFPSSEVAEEVKVLLEHAEKVQKKRIYSSRPRYIQEKKGPYALLWLVPHRDMADSLAHWIRQDSSILAHTTFSLPSPTHERPQAEVLFIDEGKWSVVLPMIRTKKGLIRAQRACRKSKIEERMKANWETIDITWLSIDKRNLTELFKTKDTKHYTSFYQRVLQ